MDFAAIEAIIMEEEKNIVETAGKAVHPQEQQAQQEQPIPEAVANQHRWFVLFSPDGKPEMVQNFLEPSTLFYLVHPSRLVSLLSSERILKYIESKEEHKPSQIKEQAEPQPRGAELDDQEDTDGEAQKMWDRRLIGRLRTIEKRLSEQFPAYIG